MRFPIGFVLLEAASMSMPWRVGAKGEENCWFLISDCWLEGQSSRISQQKSAISIDMSGTPSPLPPGRAVNEPSRARTDWLLLLGFCAFLFFFGLNYFGLIGADEPRYAQIAREMLARHDWTTPVLGGRPWLEKPVLYYWEAMLAYSIFGVSDWAARIPSALDATLLVIAVYFFLHRFRPDFQLDGALVTASAAGTVGFARAASTDMPLAAALSIALLGWYAWHESEKRAYLAGFYAFLAIGTLAKGPVAVLLVALIILLYAAAAGEYQLLGRTLWIPGVAFFCAIVLPWYGAVQLRNPEFFRVFILQHNLARFGTDVFHHEQPFWYFAVVIPVALVPWTIFVLLAAWENLRAWWNEPGPVLESEDRLNLFLVVWLLVPVIFFSLSRSKLPGYILPAVPAGTLLVAEYVRRHAADRERPALTSIVLHSILAAVPIIPALMIRYILVQHRLPPGTACLVSSGVAVGLAAGIAFTLRSGLGLRMLRFVTMIPVVLTVAAVLKIGGATLDETLSARWLAGEIARVEAGYLPTAVFQVPRETEYGLAFYRDQAIASYDRGEIPPRDHILVTREGFKPETIPLLAGRRVSFLGNLRAQHLEYYWVSAPGRRG
jgi:4-amino-4-deoxy-L-arabinose transferase-like glycosyltransferase